MSQIKIKLDENSACLIETKNEYELEEAISTFKSIITKLNNFLPENSLKESVLIKSQFSPNEAFDKLDSMIKSKFGNEVTWEDKKTMRCFYSRSKIKSKKMGLVWLEPIINTLIVHLRKNKESYNKVDTRGEIRYSRQGHKTLGDYPTIIINNKSDIAYVMKIIEFVYNTT